MAACRYVQTVRRIQLRFKCGNLVGVVAKYRSQRGARLRDHLTLTRY